MMKQLWIAVLFLAVGFLRGEELRAGVGRMKLTPETQPVFLDGYAARSHAATGMIHHVWAKALVFDDGSSNRVALITADLVGIPRATKALVCAQLLRRYGIGPERVFFNASHTHSGPKIWPRPDTADFTQEEKRTLLAQNRKYVDDMLAAVAMAITNLAPARLSAGCGTAGFAINRRKAGVAPVDHAVPVLRVAAPDGTVRAVLFNYACHNTTLTAENLMVSGDYAGFAMLDLEAANPGATALFVQGCAGDQNPEPRHTVEWAKKHGREMADAVQRVMAGGMRSVRGPIRTGDAEARLDFQVDDLDAYFQEGQSPDPYRRNRATKVLESYNNGNPILSLPYEVRALRFGDDLALLFLGGEAVVDYALRAKREYAREQLIVAGYSEWGCYIPSARVLKEGGYEGGGYSVYGAFPGPFKETVEETVFDAVRKAMGKADVRAATFP